MYISNSSSQREEISCSRAVVTNAENIGRWRIKVTVVYAGMFNACAHPVRYLMSCNHPSARIILHSQKSDDPTRQYRYAESWHRHPMYDKYVDGSEKKKGERLPV